MLVDDVVDHEEKKEGGTDVKELEMFFCRMLRRGLGFNFNNLGAIRILLAGRIRHPRKENREKMAPSCS